MLLSVEVISDVICPWCYIGKRRLEKALAALEGNHNVTVHWLPYQLNPSMPPEGISRQEYRLRKFGSLERSKELDANVKANGIAEGIEFVFDRIERTPNTVDAHKLIWLAEKEGCQDAVVEALFQAYFTKGIDISKQPNLLDVAVGAGLDRQSATKLLSGNEETDAFAEAGSLSAKHQIDGVPFFIINHTVAFAGAQPANVFLEAFHRVLISS